MSLKSILGGSSQSNTSSMKSILSKGSATKVNPKKAWEETPIWEKVLSDIGSTIQSLPLLPGILGKEFSADVITPAKELYKWQTAPLHPETPGGKSEAQREFVELQTKINPGAVLAKSPMFSSLTKGTMKDVTEMISPVLAKTGQTTIKPEAYLKEPTLSKDIENIVTGKYQKAKEEAERGKSNELYYSPEGSAKIAKESKEKFLEHPGLETINKLSTLAILSGIGLKAAGLPTTGQAVAKAVGLPESENLIGSLTKAGVSKAAEKSPRVAGALAKHEAKIAAREATRLAGLEQSAQIESMMKEPFYKKLSTLSDDEAAQLQNIVETGRTTGLIKSGEKAPQHIDDLAKEWGLRKEASRQAIREEAESMSVSEIRQLSKGYKGSQRANMDKLLREMPKLEKQVVGKTDDETSSLLKQSKLWVVEETMKETPFDYLMKITGRTRAELENTGFKPEYFPHFFEEMNPYSQAKLPSTIAGVGKKTPGYMKGRLGKEGYIRDPRMYMPLQGKIEITHNVLNDLVKDLDDLLSKSKKELTQIGEGATAKIIDNNGVEYVKYNRKITDELGIKPKTGRVVRKDRYIPLAAKKELQNLANPSTVEKFLNTTPVLKQAVGATNVWRMSVLNLSPRWVFNNFVGNLGLNFLAGVDNPYDYFKAYKQISLEKKIGKLQDMGDIAGAKALEKKLPITIAEHQAVESGAPFIREVQAGHIQSRGGGALNKLGRDIEETWLSKTNTKVNAFIEDQARTANYISGRAKGLTQKESLSQVNKFLFDYSKLNPTEKNLVRKAVPFYTWQKNITKLAMTYPTDNPMRWSLLNKAIAMTKPEEQEMLPEYLQGNINLTKLAKGLGIKGKVLDKFKDKEGKDLYLSTRGMNPFADVIALNVTDPSELIRPLNPLLKVLYEAASGKSSLTGKEFSTPYPKYNAQGEEIQARPSMMRLLMRQVPQLSLAEQIAYPYSRYDTGEPMLEKSGKPVYTRDPLLDIAKLFGINITPRDVEEIKKRGEERRQSAERYKTNYEKKRKLFEEK